MVVTGAFHLGGGIAAANRLAFWALKDAGYALDILALNESLSDPSREIGRQAGFSNNKVRFALAVWRAVLSRRYTFIFCDHVNLAAVLLPFRLLTRLPIVVRLNGVEVFAPYPSIEGWLGLRAATYLTAISDYTRTQVIDQFPQLTVTTVDLSLSPSASDLSDTSPLAAGELTLESVDGSRIDLQSRCILLVGRMASNERYKGQDVLIQAMASILTRHPTAQLVLVGRGDDYEWLRQIALSQPTEVRNSIFMPGFVDDDLLQRLYQHCYLFAMPSRGEGFGLVYLEAMRWSRACLGSKVDAASTIIVDRETGVLVSDPTDVQQVASAIIDLMNNPATVEQMGRNGFKRLDQQYLFKHFSQRFIGWIDQCTSRSRRSLQS